MKAILPLLAFVAFLLAMFAGSTLPYQVARIINAIGLTRFFVSRPEYWKLAQTFENESEWVVSRYSAVHQNGFGFWVSNGPWMMALWTNIPSADIHLAHVLKGQEVPLSFFEKGLFWIAYKRLLAAKKIKAAEAAVRSLSL